MAVVAALVVGFVAGRLAWVLLRPTLVSPPFVRENYRGRVVPVAAGVVLPVAVMVVEGGRALARSLGERRASGISVDRALVLVVVLGFTLLGLLDDLGGSGDIRGFRGHVVRLRRGHLTSGGLKLVAGAALAIVVAGPAHPDAGTGRLLADAALIALAANLANLLDRRPGRTLKGVAAAFAVLAVATGLTRALAGAAVAVGAALALIVDDLHERLMLGDTGANAVGAVLGLAVVLACAPRTRSVVLVALLVLNLVSELVSFTRLIDSLPPLRWLDQLGRRD